MGDWYLCEMLCQCLCGINLLGLAYKNNLANALSKQATLWKWDIAPTVLGCDEEDIGRTSPTSVTQPQWYDKGFFQAR
eukprot:15352337-Ditylum_brightwellii.AAC.2